MNEEFTFFMGNLAIEFILNSSKKKLIYYFQTKFWLKSLTQNTFTDFDPASKLHSRQIQTIRMN